MSDFITLRINKLEEKVSLLEQEVIILKQKLKSLNTQRPHYRYIGKPFKRLL